SIAISMIRFIAAPPLRNHSAVEHLVHDRSGDLVEELLSHLWIAFEEAEDALLLRTRRLAAVLPQLLARRRLIFLNHLVDNHIEQRTLRVSQAGCRNHCDDDERFPMLAHCVLLSLAGTTACALKRRAELSRSA